MTRRIRDLCRPTLHLALAFVALCPASAVHSQEEDERTTPWHAWKRGPEWDEDDFPFAVWLQAPRNAKRYRELGIDLYVGLWKGPTDEQLKELERHGMPAVAPWGERARRHLDREIIVGWMHPDEPDNAQPKEDGDGYGPPIPPSDIAATYREIVERDPTRPVFLNLGQGVAWDGWHGRGVRSGHPEDYPEYVKGADVVSFDIYPVVHPSPEVAGRLEYVAHGVERLRKWAGDGRPVWSVIECTRISNTDRKPSPKHVRAEVWMAIVHGARGIVYFCHKFEPEFVEAALLADEEMAAAVAEINREVQELAPVIHSPAVEGALAIDTEPAGVSPELRRLLGERPIAAAVRRHEDSLFVFAVRMEGETASATFRLDGAAMDGGVDVIGEDREVELREGAFRDRFGPWRVHLYRVPAAR